MTGILIRGLEKRFQASTAIDRVDLEIKQGELLTLLGPSGCGKTTTLRCVAGLETPSAGQIHINDKLVVDAHRKKMIPPHKRNVGMVFQSYALWPHLTVQQNVAFPLRRHRVDKSEINSRVHEALAAVGMVEHSGRFSHELSGGQQQRIALARGLLSARGVMLFDEPLSNLDAKLRMTMRSEIRRLHDKYGHTAIYVTHDQEEALAISDRIVIMNKGRIEQIGLPQEVYSHPKTRFVADFLGFQNIFKCLDVISTEVGPTAILEGGLQVPVSASLAKITPGASLAFRAYSVSKWDYLHDENQDMKAIGVIEEVTYFGSAIHYVVSLKDDKKITVEVPADELPQRLGKVGENVILGIPPQTAVLLDA